MRSRDSVVSRRLPWVFLQGFLFLPPTFPDAEWTDYGWMAVFPVLLFGWVAFCLVRNVGRLLRAPAVEATTWTAIRLAACGSLLTLLGIGISLEARLLEDRLLALVWATLGAILLYFAARDVARRRSRESVSAF
jgi:hypothetical protein